MESPNKLARLQSEPILFGKGFTSLIKAENAQQQPEQQNEVNEGNFRSSWKSFDVNDHSPFSFSNKKSSIFQVKQVENGHDEISSSRIKKIEN